MFLVQKVNYIPLHKCFGCESIWQENSKFVQCDPKTWKNEILIHMCATNQQVRIFFESQQLSLYTFCLMKQIEVKFISKLFHIPMKCDFCILHT
jgi:hypothetical protein